MLNIRFEPELYLLLKQESKRTGLSIPALVNKMIKTILKKEEINETNEQTRTPTISRH